MKRIILLLIVITLFFTSCSLGGSHMFGKLFRSDKEIANESFEKILNAIQNQDNSALKNLFSKKSVAASYDFDGSMTALFNFFKGQMLSYNDWGGPNTSDGMNDDGTGRNWKSIQSTFDVETKEGNYRFAIKTFIKDTADSDNVGIHSLYIIKAENSDIQFAYWGDGKWTPGIVIEQNIE